MYSLKHPSHIKKQNTARETKRRAYIKAQPITAYAGILIKLLRHLPSPNFRAKPQHSTQPNWHLARVCQKLIMRLRMHRSRLNTHAKTKLIDNKPKRIVAIELGHLKRAQCNTTINAALYDLDIKLQSAAINMARLKNPDKLQLKTMLANPQAAIAMLAIVDEETLPHWASLGCWQDWLGQADEFDINTTYDKHLYAHPCWHFLARLVTSHSKTLLKQKNISNKPDLTKHCKQLNRRYEQYLMADKFNNLHSELVQLVNKIEQDTGGMPIQWWRPSKQAAQQKHQQFRQLASRIRLWQRYYKLHPNLLLAERFSLTALEDLCICRQALRFLSKALTG